MSLGTFTYESGPIEFEDFPQTEEPVYILGEIYSAQYDREELKSDIRSRLWITYRRNFAHIGGTGPSSDQGWGCMLRCGQMMLAQALLLRHLGRGWRWRQSVLDDPAYWRLLQMFEDKKTATYSIHQIASMGEAEGKAIGQWFGPNTIAQVLKRISVFDEWSNIGIHIALDNLVILDEIYAVCKQKAYPPRPTQTNGETPDPNGERPPDLPAGEIFSKFVNDADKGEGPDHHKEDWRPLLLIIPLRLGLTEINPIYFDGLKRCFGLRQSVGIIGGKPNHAHWFIGYFGKELIYLDPHTTQPVVDLEDRSQSDESYHCLTPPSRMAFHKLDPSIALGFYCHSEKDLTDLCESLSSQPDKGKPNMFEIRKEAPKAYYTPPAQPCSGPRNRGASLTADFTILSHADGSSSVDDEEEFEII